MMRKNLTKLEILRKKSDIDAVFREGKRYSSRSFRLIIRENGLLYNRMIVIPARKFGNSCQRNKIRRQVKEIWRGEKPLFLTGFDFAIVVYPQKVLSFQVQKKKLLELFGQAGVHPRQIG